MDLRESSPVLTVASRKQTLRGSVGKPLPASKLRDNPDDSGVGEVIARGQNVMVGYTQRRCDRSVLAGRWLRTGDLGKIDEEGNVFIVGRSKDVINRLDGKNINRTRSKIFTANPIRSKNLVWLVFLMTMEVKRSHAGCPDYEKDIALSRSEVNKKIEEHFREGSAGFQFSNV